MAGYTARDDVWSEQLVYIDLKPWSRGRKNIQKVVRKLLRTSYSWKSVIEECKAKDGKFDDTVVDKLCKDFEEEERVTLAKLKISALQVIDSMHLVYTGPAITAMAPELVGDHGDHPTHRMVKRLISEAPDKWNDIYVNVEYSKVRSEVLKIIKNPRSWKSVLEQVREAKGETFLEELAQGTLAALEEIIANLSDGKAGADSDDDSDGAKRVSLSKVKSSVLAVLDKMFLELHTDGTHSPMSAADPVDIGQRDQTPGKKGVFEFPDLPEVTVAGFSPSIIRLIFKSHDKSGTGVLNFEEFREAVQELGFPIAEEEMHTAFGKIDSESSGQIDFDQFCAAVNQYFAVNKAVLDDPEAAHGKCVVM